MIYSNEFGTVNFFDEYPELYSKKNIGINLSGGVDSAFLLFILCKKIKTNNLNIKIIPITGVDYERPLNIFHARTIVKLFEKKFKMNNVFEKHEEFWYRKFYFWWENNPAFNEKLIRGLILGNKGIIV